MLFTIPVSIGEGVDKLTILDIKLANIKDTNRLADVKKEYDALTKSLETYILKCSRQYNLLKHINTTIWKLEDEIREELSDERCAKVAKSIAYENDCRFRTKDKINKMCSSELKEQKGYAYKSLYKLMIENTDNIVYTHIDFILEKSVRFDKIEVSFEEGIADNIIEQISEYFSYDNSIQFIKV
jgi:hypothetical protein